MFYSYKLKFLLKKPLINNNYCLLEALYIINYSTSLSSSFCSIAFSTTSTEETLFSSLTLIKRTP
jgi:hypothetical protein